jgi:PHS family inorganic phosphate transporter-like MFS transporter
MLSFILKVVCRVLLGIGVGGDYPMSASVSSDRVSVRKRGTMLAYVFANQVRQQRASILAPFLILHTGLGLLRR